MVLTLASYNSLPANMRKTVGGVCHVKGANGFVPVTFVKPKGSLAPKQPKQVA